MIVDASAVLAVLLHEEDAASFARAIEAADVLRMSVVVYARGVYRPHDARGLARRASHLEDARRGRMIG